MGNSLPVTTTGRSAPLLGATGLVGNECLRRLLADDAFLRVVVVTRTPFEPERNSAKLERHVADFEHLTLHADRFEVDIICALGTTMKQAGSRARFRTVDLVYPLTAAHLGLERGASHFLVVSAVGADSGSRIFYNRTKGELEDALRALSYPCLTLFRPSLLAGSRARPRTAERIAGALSFAFPAKYRPVTAVDVARAIVDAAIAASPGIKVIEPTETLPAPTLPEPIPALRTSPM
ncbi:MAG: oxidoreductase [Gemmatimonadaceae bacterium]